MSRRRFVQINKASRLYDEKRMREKKMSCKGHPRYNPNYKVIEPVKLFAISAQKLWLLDQILAVDEAHLLFKAFLLLLLLLLLLFIV